MKILSLALILLCLKFNSGCMTVFTQTLGSIQPSTYRGPMSGTMNHIKLGWNLTNLPGKPQIPAFNKTFKSVWPFIVLIDLPLSLGADAAILPVSTIRFIFFDGGSFWTVVPRSKDKEDETHYPSQSL